MYNVTDDQVDFILNDITKRGIVIEDVKYNILDHVCCIIENEMKNEEDFYEFYEDTIARFYQKELREIELETRELITFKYLFAMKRTLKISGLISVLLILSGIILKMMHLPGAGIALVLGFVFFSLVFIPLNIVLKWRDNKKKYNQLVMTLGLGLTLTGTVGLLFKVMHWPFANYIFYGSLATFVLVFIPAYFITRFRAADTKFNAVIHTIFMVAASGMLFSLMNISNSHHVQNSIDKLEQLDTDQYLEIKSQNENLVNELNHEKVSSVHLITTDFINEIEKTEYELISKSNGTSENNDLSSTEVKLQNPNDVKVVMDHLDEQELEDMITKYNKSISSYTVVYTQELDPDKLQMKHTTIGILLKQFLELKEIVVMNERNLLSYYKGQIE